MIQQKRTPRLSATTSTAQLASSRSRRLTALTLLTLAVPLLVVLGWTACSPNVQHASQPESLADPCAIALSAPGGVQSADGQIRRLQQEARQARNPSLKLERLGWLYVSRARTRYDPGFYRLADQAAACMEKSAPDSSAAALLLRGHVEENLHHFQEAERLARRLVARRESPFDYGLLGDALMEQGRLDEAAAAYQKMVDLRPGLESYSRAAHLRWLHGDLEGATALMRLATRAGGPRNAEPTAWAYSRLALYELQSGAFDNALQAARNALELQPKYAPALLAQGRILLAAGKAEQAIEPLADAARLNPLPEYQWLLAETLRAAGRIEEARAVESKIERQGATSDPRTFALYLATRKRSVATAVQLAERELDLRSDVFTYDALAWSLFAAGETERASQAMKTALGAGTQDARLFLHAALIADARGASAEAAHFRQKAGSLRYLLLPSELERLNAARNSINPKPSSS
jgi:tetratricopeptide (TPR) repeat protein